MTRAVLPNSRKLILFFVVAAVLAAGMTTSWQWYRANASEPLFRTDHPTRDRLVTTIVATGTIEPEQVIDVGAQVAGQITAFGRDPANPKRTIDYGSSVEEGTVLARIDEALYAPEVDIARAELGVCQADVRHQESELAQMRAQLYKADRDWERAKRLESQHSISQTEVDATQSAWETAKAAVPASEADLEKAKRAVEKARGTLVKAEKNLGYCTIKSPVKGIIIDRRVNVGQTVVSSFNAPSLFLIAKDLRRLQIWVSVNEADIGNIYSGQDVTFTVDSYPADVFHGTVGQIRLNATMTQNVVTYTVIVNVDNGSDGKTSSTAGATKDAHSAADSAAVGKLLPYLTANVQFKVDERKDALLVPNAALHYRPTLGLVAPEFRSQYEQGMRSASVEETGAERPAKGRLTRATVWVPDGECVRPVKVRVGLTDGLMTEVAEVVKDKLTPETEVVIGENESAVSRETTVNPFGPHASRKK
jgi:HlyD family secretion protein